MMVMAAQTALPLSLGFRVRVLSCFASLAAEALFGCAACLGGKSTVADRTKALYSVVGEPAQGVPEHLALATACVRYWVKVRLPLTASQLILCGWQ